MQSAPPEIARYHGECRELTAWCRELEEILWRISENKHAIAMQTACQRQRNDCASIDPGEDAQAFGKWLYLNDMFKLNPPLMVKIINSDADGNPGVVTSDE